MKSIMGVIFFFFILSFFDPLEAYQRLSKNSRAYYYTQSKPYWKKKPKRQWDRNAYKSYFYYGKEVYPQYTYVLPGHFYFYGYPNYYHNDNGDVYYYWGYY